MEIRYIKESEYKKFFDLVSTNPNERGISAKGIWKDGEFVFVSEKLNLKVKAIPDKIKMINCEELIKLITKEK